MSSILKALKKLEEEKARKEGGSSDIARDILRTPYRRRRQNLFGPAVAIAIGAAALAVVLIGGYRLWREPPPSSSVAVPRPADAPSRPQGAGKGEPVLVEKEDRGEKPSPAAAEKTAAGSAETGADAVAVEPRQGATTSVMAEEMAVGGADGKAGEVVWEEKAPTGDAFSRALASGVEADAPAADAAAADAAAAKSASPAGELGDGNPDSSTDGPSLFLSGIAYQQDRESRLAIVNDLPVMEGTVIEGVLVEEILKDRVLFSSEGRTFEIPLSDTQP